jgi:hypothetical protein
MELSTITRIEQYMVDALVASPLIPISVNVLRLADAIENEGIVQQTNNIVVRYTGASNVVKNRIPMVFERQMSFELDFSCQNYLTSSGHDFATQLLTGAFITYLSTGTSDNICSRGGSSTRGCNWQRISSYQHGILIKNSLRYGS